ncbi:MAG TPA: ATP-binding protein [Candidatus Dojkabacteria bacterium]|nr:ATP-binding protein [Candidatus Dojkabacteria bacterium]
MAEKSGYKVSDIQVLKGLEAVRKRPAMYIGSTDKHGLHHIFTEILDNSVDEAIAGYCKNIWVTLNKDGSLTVKDNGRGIPVDKHPETKVSTLETVMTNLHAGGKFEKGAYKVSGGLHGVGMKCTNALSEWMQTTVHFDGGIYTQRYERGIPVEPVKRIGDTKETGTEHTFAPDPMIFSETEFDFDTIVKQCRQHAYLTAGLRISVIDQTEEEEKRYDLYFEDGIKSYVQFLNIDSKTIGEEPLYINKTDEDVVVEVAMQYTDGMEEDVRCYTNNIVNPEGGTHLAGFRTAVTSAFNNYAQKEELLKNVDGNLSGDDVREGLTAVISVKVADPQFEGQTKIKLNNPEVKSIVARVVRDEITTYLEENPKEAKDIVGKAVLANKAKAAAKAARDAVIRKSALESTTLPGKLADCTSNDPTVSELFIVEGDSAGGCFSGDTKVALVDGRSISFLKLIEEQKQGKTNYCYTIAKNRKIAISEIQNVRKTKSNTKVVKITLDNQEEIVCTPNHKFMLRDGSYKQAKNLTPKDSLMPFNRKLSEKKGRITIEGYEMVFNPSDSKWIFTHLLSDRYNLEKNLYSKTPGTHKHHIDFNKLNNRPENIVRLDKEVHLKLHQKHISKTCHTEEVFEKLRILKKTPEFREKMRQTMSKPQTRKLLSHNAKRQWENEEYKQYMLEKFLAFYYTNEEYQKASQKRLNKAQKDYWTKKGNRIKQSHRTSKYFETHPELKKELSKLAKEQWSDSNLLKWRSKQTKAQWTDEFRERRRKAYNKTYLDRGLKVMRSIYEQIGELSEEIYDKVRIESKDKTLIKMSTICDRFFNGDYARLEDAVRNYNHKIVSIEYLKKRIDVYDLEVPHTHNFALHSGVFVHNSAKQGRDRHTQAILPLRGKIMNTQKYRVDRVLSNNEFNDVTTALGVGIGETLDISKLRYHKIIIMSDADVDGLHITTLVLTLLFRFFKPLIKEGYVYVAQPPLHKVEIGKKKYYFINDADKDAFVKKAKQEGKVPVENRFKGLGEMNPDQLWETTMNPETRVLKRVEIQDAEEAEKTFEMLMGTEVPPRRRFIQTYAASANLDV